MTTREIQCICFPAKTKCGRELLVDSEGYQYTQKRDKRRSNVNWRCSVRSRNFTCHASVLERSGRYFRGSQDHTCTPNSGRAVIQEELGRAVVEEVVGRAVIQEDVGRVVVQEDLDKAVIHEDVGRVVVQEALGRVDVQEDLGREDVKKDLGREDVKKDLGTEDVKKDLGTEDVKKDLGRLGVHEDLGRATVQESLSRVGVQESLSRVDVQESLSRVNVQEDLVTVVIPEDLGRAVLQEDLDKAVIQEDLSRMVVQEALDSAVVQEDLSREEFQKDLDRAGIQEDLCRVDVQKDLGRLDVQDALGSAVLQEDLSREDFQKDLDRAGIQEDLCRVDVKKDLGRLDVQEDLGRAVVQEDLNRKDVKKDIHRLDIQEYLGRVDVQKDLGRTVVQENLCRVVVQEVLGRAVFQEYVSSENIKNDLGRLDVQEDLGRADVQENISRVDVEKDLGRLVGQEDLGRAVVQEDLNREDVKNDLGRLDVQEDLGRAAVQEDISRLKIQEDLGRAVVQEILSRVDIKENVNRLGFQECLGNGDRPTNLECGFLPIKTRRGKNLLIDSNGFQYTRKIDKRRSNTIWRCRVRNKTICCKASVIERTGQFSKGLHDHTCSNYRGFGMKTSTGGVQIKKEPKSPTHYEKRNLKRNPSESIECGFLPLKTNRGQDLLIDNEGFQYTRKIDKRRSHKNWRCRVRNKMICCKASVLERNGQYFRGLQRHTCVPNQGGKRNEDQASSKTADVGKGSIEEVLHKAEECIDAFDIEMAQKYCQKASEIDPENARVLEITGNLLIEIGDVEGAKKCFGRAVTICPDSGFTKYMYLAQLLQGQHAIDCYCKGIDIILKNRQQENAEQDVGACATSEGKPSDSDIARAYCSVAEIYLTDSCFEDKAETECHRNLELALQYNSESAEAYQLMASYYLSTHHNKSAKKMIKKSLSLWLPKLKDIESSKAVGNEFDPVETCSLSYLTRVSTVKILIELEQFDVAEEILQMLLEEDDEVVEVWYLLGWLHVLQETEDSNSYARHFLFKAKKLGANSENSSMKEHIDDLLNKLGPGNGEDEDDWLQKQIYQQAQDNDDNDDDDNELTDEEEGDMEH